MDKASELLHIAFQHAVYGDEHPGDVTWQGLNKDHIKAACSVFLPRVALSSKKKDELVALAEPFVNNWVQQQLQAAPDQESDAVDWLPLEAALPAEAPEGAGMVEELLLPEIGQQLDDAVFLDVDGTEMLMDEYGATGQDNGGRRTSRARAVAAPAQDSDSEDDYHYYN